MLLQPCMKELGAPYLYSTSLVDGGKAILMTFTKEGWSYVVKTYDWWAYTHPVEITLTDSRESASLRIPIHAANTAEWKHTLGALR